MARARITVACLSLAALAACGAASRGPSAVGSSRVTLSVQPLRGGSLGPRVLDDVMTTLRHRLSAAGLHGTMNTTAGRDVVITVPSSAVSRVETLSTQVGILRFRQVLEVGDYTGGSTSASPAVEAPTLSRSVERSFATWDCAKNPSPSGGTDRPGDYIVACDPPGTKDASKYLLAPAAVEGSQVGSANAGLTADSADWVVNLAFTGSGVHDWFVLTKRTYEATGSGRSGFGSCRPPKGCNAVAITLDGVVESAPAAQQDGIPGGLTEISGDFTETAATNLADILKYGALPARLVVVDVRTTGG